MSTYLLPYMQGTISLENGSKVVTGSGTAFLINAKIGDLLQLDDGIMRAIGVAPTSEVAIVSANCVNSLWGGSPINFVSLDNAEWKLTCRGGNTSSRGGSGYLLENSGSVTVVGKWTGPTSDLGEQVYRAIVAVKYAA